MNIHSSFDPTPASPSNVQTVRPSSATSEASAVAKIQPLIADGDTASISAAAAALGASDVRADKVAAIQQALANGNYSVSPEELAGKLINHMLHD